MFGGEERDDGFFVPFSRHMSMATRRQVIVVRLTISVPGGAGCRYEPFAFAFAFGQLAKDRNFGGSRPELIIIKYRNPKADQPNADRYHMRRWEKPEQRCLVGLKEK